MRASRCCRRNPTTKTRWSIWLLRPGRSPPKAASCGKTGEKGEIFLYEHGWFQIAFEKDLSSKITPLLLYGRRLMAIKREDGTVAIFDSSCPHRGTDLTKAGTVSAGD